MTDQTTNKLLEQLQVFLNLNPQVSREQLETLYSLARQVPAEDFSHVKNFVEKLIERYIDSPWKKTNASMLVKYYNRLENTSQELRAEEPTETDSSDSSQINQSVALTGPPLEDPLTYCRVISAADIPKTLQKAVDACQERNNLLLSVVEYTLRILHLVDSGQSFKWELGFIARKKGTLDPDVVRDLLRVWRDQTEIDSAALRWVLEWSHDNVLQRRWPTVTAEANAVIRQHLLCRWLNNIDRRGTALTHLRLILVHHRQTNKLRQWLSSSIADFGESVDFFVSFAKKQISAKREATASSNWTSSALWRELQFIQTLFVPVLVLSEILLSSPNGAYHFALSLLGLTGRGWEQWHNALAREAETTILGLFLRGFKEGTPPSEIIHQLSFGDDQLYRNEMAELDVGTGQFGSVEQRDKVVKDLATYYTSYLESCRLPHEITRRYRDIMRVVHEDNLHRRLTGEQLKAVDWTMLREVNTLVAAARQFLSKRRALHTSLEEMTAAEMEFAQSVRERRYFLLRHYLMP